MKRCGLLFLIILCAWQAGALVVGVAGSFTGSQRSVPPLSAEDAHLVSAAPAESAMKVACDLVEAGRFSRALALYRGVEESTKPGPTWAVATYNEALLLHKMGDNQASRDVLLRLIDSGVNDKDPGATLMETNRNYHHHAANLMAADYRADGQFQMAYLWRVRAASVYKFRSWCGTCSAWEDRSMSLCMFKDAALAGPFVVVAHLLMFPGRSWLAWLLIVVAVAVVRRRWPGGRSVRVPGMLE